MKIEYPEAAKQTPHLESLAAELTYVAYRVALRHGVGDKWINLQMDLWKAMAEAIESQLCLHQMKLVGCGCCSRRIDSDMECQQEQSELNSVHSWWSR